ncbi:hypothetical protein LOD99_15210 [Oopsacas minuta]|uniref:Uncharacterized protein n=1 Tax=Oopsacas minuta TaxID=111878 RepID=A0AAV7KB48_9METZ|nr:hypothetical protein LOD99_15210 [Oopsacas minuta]
MSASEGANIAAMTVTTLRSLRTDDHFTAFWDHLINAQQDLDVCVPKLPRRRKVPKRYDDGAPVDFPDECQTHYRQSYFESLDLVVKAIEDRFDQPDYNLYRRLDELLIHPILGESTQEYFDFVANLP